MVGTELLPWVFTTGWASGINAYLVVLILGIAEKVFHVSGVPDALGRTDVMIGAAVLFLLEMFADKIPYVDSFWDTAHTVIRPAVGATLGYLIGHESSSLEAAFGAATGGFSALAAHLVKAGTRAAVNTSPEPASNVIVSTAEDVTVAGVVSLAFLNPLGVGGHRCDPPGRRCAARRLPAQADPPHAAALRRLGRSQRPDPAAEPTGTPPPLMRGGSPRRRRICRKTLDIRALANHRSSPG